MVQFYYAEINLKNCNKTFQQTLLDAAAAAWLNNLKLYNNKSTL